MSTKSPRDRPTDDSPEAESRDAPMIPSFDSLRARRRRSPIDVLVPEPDTAPSVAAAAGGAAPRPPDYADLMRLGVHVIRALAIAPVRLAVWSVREPVRLLHRLGRPRGSGPE